MDQDGRKELVTRDNSDLSISRQCRLLAMNRSSMYYKTQDATAREIELKHLIDRIHTDHPSWGTRRISAHLIKQGYFVGRKRVRRYMQEMRIYAIYPKPNLSLPNKQHKAYPYLLRHNYKTPYEVYYDNREVS